MQCTRPLRCNVRCVYHPYTQRIVGSTMHAGWVVIKRDWRVSEPTFGAKHARRDVTSHSPGLLLGKKTSTILEETMDGIDMHIIPQDLLNLVGSNHLFEIKTHTYYDNHSYVSFTLNKVIEANIHVQTMHVQTKRGRDADDDSEGAPPSKIPCTRNLMATIASSNDEVDNHPLKSSDDTNNGVVA